MSLFGSLFVFENEREFSIGELAFPISYVSIVFVFPLMLIGGGLLFISNLIQKVWNIDFNIQRMADGYSIPVDYSSKKRYKDEPIAASKKPTNPESDMSKYAP